MKTFSLLPHFSSIILLLCLSSNTNGFAQGTPSEFTTKLQNLIDKTSQIRDVFQNIVVQLDNEGAPGFDKVVDFGEQMKDKLDSLRKKVSKLTNLFNLEKLSILNNEVDVKKQIFSGKWKFNIPEVELKTSSSDNSPSATPIPKFKSFLTNFLSMLDEPLDNLLNNIQALNDSINTNLAIAKSHQKYIYPPEPGSFPEAEYWYPDIIRETLGKPGIVLLLKVDYEIWETDARLVEAVAEQDIDILGEGGNLGVLKAVNVIVGCIGLVKEVAEHVEGLETFDLDVGSYKRIAYVHEEVDTLRTDFRNWVNLSIRTRIEINLAGHGDHPHPIAMFQLPAQFGGYLELARDIVQETINTMLAAGEDVHQSQLFLEHGNQEFLASHYKKAYEWYSKSYDEATK